jgi:hypothetical protein
VQTEGGASRDPSIEAAVGVGVGELGGREGHDSLSLSSSRCSEAHVGGWGVGSSAVRADGEGDANSARESMWQLLRFCSIQQKHVIALTKHLTTHICSSGHGASVAASLPELTHVIALTKPLCSSGHSASSLSACVAYVLSEALTQHAS